MELTLRPHDDPHDCPTRAQRLATGHVAALLGANLAVVARVGTPASMRSGRWHEYEPARLIARTSRSGAVLGRSMVVFPIVLVSFGFDVDRPPVADRVVDVRALLAPVPGHLRAVTGLDPRVHDVVQRSAGTAELMRDLTAYAENLPTGQPRRIAIGSVNGRHRSVALVCLLARELTKHGRAVTTAHPNLPPVRRR